MDKDPVTLSFRFFYKQIAQRKRTDVTVAPRIRIRL